MLKNITKLECSIQGKSFQFLCDNDSPLEYVKEALFQYLKYVGQIEDQVKTQQDLQKKEQEKKVESFPEENFVVDVDQTGIQV